MSNLFFDISLIIPCYENLEVFKNVFNSILLQKTKPKEIIVVDSSLTNKIEYFINSKKKFLDDINIIYYKGQKLYPGKARNIGASLSNCEWIAFIDSKTIALENWLQDYKEILKKNDYDVIFGSTKFFAKENEKISNLFLQSTYGNSVHQTVPGTLIKKNIFNMNQFLENVRSGEDIFWREKLVNNIFIKYYSPDSYYLRYEDISNNFNENLRKHFLYSIHTSIISIKNNIKDLYLSLFLILTALLIPKWNVLIGGWDTNPLYVPNITKLYFLSLIFILLTYIIYRNLNFKIIKETLFLKIIYIIIFIFLSIFVIKWNETYSLIYYDAIFKFPHITKIYLFFIIFISIVFRGLYMPYNRDISLKKLLFFNWIKIGITGLCIDIIKSPAFIIGSFISIFKMDILFNKSNLKYTKKCL